jgi:predicted transcriptional regulator of viral defense system
MRIIEAYRELKGIGRPVLSSAEAAAAWQVSPATTAQRLRALLDSGVIRRVRRGLWSLDPEIDPFAIGPYLTAPRPAYVSLWSALAKHGMIDQIPRSISLISTDRARRITTALGVYEVHRIAPELFAGYGSDKQGVYMAVPEKALFDLVYVRSAHGHVAYLPELTLPSSFNRNLLLEWGDRIASQRLRTLVSRRLHTLVSEAQAGTP